MLQTLPFKVDVILKLTKKLCTQTNVLLRHLGYQVYVKITLTFSIYSG